MVGDWLLAYQCLSNKPHVGFLFWPVEHPVHLHKEIIPASTALVRKTMKYIDWPGWDTEQLFNLTSDPQEEHDEINNPFYAEVLKEMRARHNVLREWVK
jgi:arylsulfatase